MPNTTEATITADDIVTEILGGRVDADLAKIAHAVKQRRSIATRRTFQNAGPGAKATLQNLSPKYMVGAPVTIVSQNRTRIVVNIDDTWLAANPQATRWAGNITVTHDMLNFGDN